MSLRKDTRDIQEDLGAYCRNGQEEGLARIPGLTSGRVEHYRRLVYQVVRDSMDAAYPITLAALEENQWDALVQDFFSNGQPKSPQIWKLPFEFYTYHLEQSSGDKLGLPWLDDLLYFEWMEIEVYNMPDREHPKFRHSGDLLRDRLVLNPEHEVIRLGYPVHLHSVGKATELAGDYFVLLYREPEKGRVRFMDLSALHVYLLSQLLDDQLTVNDLKHDIARQTGIESLTYLEEVLGRFLAELQHKGFVLGSQLS